jgi:hypothetical protein
VAQGPCPGAPPDRVPLAAGRCPVRPASRCRVHVAKRGCPGDTGG